MAILRPSFLLPVESRGRERYVYSWEQFVEAISDFQRAAEAATNTSAETAGKTIKIGCSFYWKGTVTIPSTLNGLVVDGCNAMINTRTSGMIMFNVLAARTIFRNIIAGHDISPVTGSPLISGTQPWGGMFAGTLTFVRVEDCSITGATFIDATMNGSIVSGCNCNGLFVSPTTWVDISSGGKNIFRGNYMTATSAEAFVVAGSGKNVISSNVLGGRGIITTASSGGNTALGNTNAGTLTLHPTAVGDSAADNFNT